MRKKFTMLLAALFLVMGTAWAQVSYTVSMTTGTANQSGYFATWTNTATNANPIALKLSVVGGANNMYNESGALTLFVGGGSTYSLEVPATHRIVSYSFDFVRDDVKKPYEDNKTVTLAVGGQSFTINKTTPTEAQNVAVNNVNASSTSFRMTGDNYGIVVSNFVVTVERVFESGYYTIQCNGNNQFANYNGGERIVPMDMGRFPTSVYLFTKGDNGMYTIQTSDKKFVTYKGTGNGDQVALVDAASANDNNKWWVINETSAEVFTIVPKQDNIGANTPGWNYSVDFGGANGALGLWDRNGGNSKWLVKAAPIMTSGTAKIKCSGSYVHLADEATLFTKGNEGNACQFTVLAGEEGKYTIQLADGRFVTHKSSDSGNQIEIVEAGNATDDNKWWVIAPNVTSEKSTGNEVDIIPAHGNGIGRGTAAWNWSVNTNANLGFWGASDNGSRCTIEWTPTTFTYSYSYNGQVKRTEQAQGFVGYPYPAPTLSVFGVVPAPIVGDIVAGDQGKTFDMEYTVDLPFQFADSYDNIEHWYFMKIRDDGFTYMGYDAEKSYIRANQSNVPVASKDAYTWGFVGNPFDGFSIVNYATGKTKVLSAPVAPTGDKNADQLARMVEVTNEYTGNLVWNIKAPTHPSPRPGVFYIEHPTATGYAFNRQNYDGANAVCYWNQRDTGSAVQVVERGVFNLSDLRNQGIYALQAERSPLMYSTTAGMTTKLSSGMVDGISANANDINQQFIIFSSTTTGKYYLYSLGANKFVDADLNFTDYPEPVLSFEANANNSYYPWYVKINDKYVVPGNGGQDGNKLHHVPNPDDDDGKRYRIIKVGEDMSIATDVALIIQHANGLIKDASDLSNSKVYTVSTYDRGVWSYNAAKDALWYAASVNPDTKTEQFAFLTVGGRTYLYSVGAGKFVVMSEADANGRTYTAYSDVPSQPVEILKATGNKFFPLVVALKGGSQVYHIGISSTYEPPVITFYNDLGDPGNKVDIREAGDLENSAEILATMDAYLTAQTLVPELEALIARAGKALTYLLEADKEALATAKTNAENVLSGAYDSGMLGEQITALTTALNAAILVDDYAKFKNNYVYSFVTSRGWVGADANSENLIGTANSKVDPAPTPSEDNAMFQWAVYKSSNNHYYMYNIGKGKFMGVQSANEQPIPFADAPQSLKTTFKNISGGVEYPIMLSPDNVGAVSQNGNAGLFYWNGGWNRTDDAGSNHKVTVVGAITESTLTTIAEAVELYEEICELGDALADADNRLDAALGYYSCTVETQTELDDIEEFMATAIDVDEINAKTARVNELIATFTLNVPQAGKFYRLKGKASNKYMSTPLSTDAANRVKMRLSDNSEDAGCIFYLTANNKLLSYKLGTFLQNTHDINALGESNGNTVYFNKSESNNLGFFTLKTDYSGSKYIYDDKNDTEVDRNGSYAANNCEWTVEEVTILPVTVTAAQVTFNEEPKYVSTLFAPVALEVPAGITAYIGVKEDNYLAMDSIAGVGEAAAIIPANTGVILMADEAKTYKFSISAAAGTAIEAEANIITGTVAKTVITPDANTTCYVLANAQDGVGFYKALKNKNTSGAAGNTSFFNNACKAYIPVSVAESQAAQALAFRFRGKEQGTTEIEMPMANGQQPAVIYDLTGRRIEKIVEKGIYIVNGKKVVIK